MATAREALGDRTELDVDAEALGVVGARGGEEDGEWGCVRRGGDREALAKIGDFGGAPGTGGAELLPEDVSGEEAVLLERHGGGECDLARRGGRSGQVRGEGRALGELVAEEDAEFVGREDPQEELGEGVLRGHVVGLGSHRGGGVRQVDDGD